MIEDFTARRRAAVKAKQLLHEEMMAENERDYQIHCAEREFEDWLERERIKREKYEQVMAARNPITMDSKQAYAARRRATQPWQRWYHNPQWRRTRAAQLRAHPMCERCKTRGIDRVATVCNHVTPHRGDEVAFWAGPFNSLCASCHNSDQQRLEGGGKARPVVGADGWPIE